MDPSIAALPVDDSSGSRTIFTLLLLTAILVAQIGIFLSLKAKSNGKDMSKTYTLEEIRKMKGETDIERIKNTTEKDIMEQSISDPDTPYLTDDELKEFTTSKERKKSDEHKKIQPTQKKRN